MSCNQSLLVLRPLKMSQYLLLIIMMSRRKRRGAAAAAGAGTGGGKGAAPAPAGRVAAQVVGKSGSRGKTRLLTSAAPTALVEGKAGVDSSGLGDDAVGLRGAGVDDVPRIIVSPLAPGAAAGSGAAAGIGMETSPADRAALAYARQRRTSGVGTGTTDGNGRSSFTPHAFVSSAANKRVGRARALAHAQAQAREGGDAAEQEDDALPAASAAHLAPLPVTPRTPRAAGGASGAGAAAPPSGAELAHVMSSLQTLMQQVQSIYSAVSPSQLGGFTPNPLQQTAPSVGSGLSAASTLAAPASPTSASAPATFQPSAARSTRILFADDK